MWNQARAIIWAQWRTLWDYLPRDNRGGLSVTVLIGVVWYGMFAFLAVMAGLLASNPGELPFIAKVFPAGLLLSFLYWPLIPVLMMSMGSSLDLNKLLAYPT